MRVQCPFSAQLELTQQMVESLSENLDIVFMSRDGQLGLVQLGRYMALAKDGVAINDEDSEAHAVAAVPWRSGTEHKAPGTLRSPSTNGYA